MDYMVVKTTEVEDLEYKVRGFLKEGWNLQGGLATVSQGVSSPYIVFCQAMFCSERGTGQGLSGGARRTSDDRERENMAMGQPVALDAQPPPVPVPLDGRELPDARWLLPDAGRATMTKFRTATSALLEALMHGLPDLVENLQVGDSLHPEALRFDWRGKRYRTRLIGGRAYAETVVGHILESGPDSKAIERYLNNGLRRVTA